MTNLVNSFNQPCSDDQGFSQCGENSGWPAQKRISRIAEINHIRNKYLYFKTMGLKQTQKAFFNKIADMPGSPVMARYLNSRILTKKQHQPTAESSQIRVGALRPAISDLGDLGGFRDDFQRVERFLIHFYVFYQITGVHLQD